MTGEKKLKSHHENAEKQTKIFDEWQKKYFSYQQFVNVCVSDLTNIQVITCWYLINIETHNRADSSF